MSKHQERLLNKNERLFALVLLLQNRPRMNAQELADHFGVSRRTIFRDLRTLSEAGVPLTYAEEGGYEILEGYTLPPLMFSAREAATLLIGMEFARMQPDASLREDADRVAMKIRTVLPEPLREYIDRIKQHTVLNPYHQKVPYQAYAQSGYWYRLSEAIAQQHAVRIKYFVPSREEVTRRRVDPLGLVFYSDHWNLIGYCHLRRDIRNFRLENIRELQVLPDSFERPEGFDLQAYLEAKGMKETAYRVVLRFHPAVYRRARPYIPGIIEEERATSAGVDVAFRFENLDYLADWLLGFGDRVQVVRPESLKEKLRSRLLGVLEMYAKEEAPLPASGE